MTDTEGRTVKPATSVQLVRRHTAAPNAPAEQPAQAEAQQASDGLVEELAACEIAPFPHSLSEYYVVLVDEGLRNRILSALKTETVELLREAREACFRDALSEECPTAREEKFGLVNHIDAHLRHHTGI